MGMKTKKIYDTTKLTVRLRDIDCEYSQILPKTISVNEGALEGYLDVIVPKEYFTSTEIKKRLFINLSVTRRDDDLLHENGYHNFNPRLDYCIHQGGCFPIGRGFDEVIYLSFDACKEDLELTPERLRFFNDVYMTVATRIKK